MLKIANNQYMSDSRKRHEALLYHAKPKPGKIEVVPTKNTQHNMI